MSAVPAVWIPELVFVKQQVLSCCGKELHLSSSWVSKLRSSGGFKL